MKIFLSIWFALLFVLPVFAQQKTEDQYANIPTVDYCELRKNPDLYNGKTIRVRGIYRRGFEIEAFYDERCFDKRSSLYETWVGRSSMKLSCSDKKTAEILETFFEFGEDIEAVLIGIFNGSKERGFYGHMGYSKYQISLYCIEEAKLLPTEKYGCTRIDDTKPFHYLSYVKTETGKTTVYEKVSKKQKDERLIWLSLNNNSSCPVTVPTILNEPENLKDKSEVPVIYTLTSQCSAVDDKLITKRKETLSVLSSGNSIYFTVPLKYLTDKPFEVRIPFSFQDRKAASNYEPFYFSRYSLPKKLAKDLDCPRF